MTFFMHLNLERPDVHDVKIVYSWRQQNPKNMKRKILLSISLADLDTFKAKLY